MKVYIGNYETHYIRSRLFDAYMNKKYGVVKWPENYTKFETLLEKFDDALQSVYNKTINKLIKNRKRKIKVRIDPYDTWNMDNTLAHVILPMLRQLKETKHGTPSVDDEDVPENLRSTSAPPRENDWELDDNYHARWDWVLDEMIYTFECEVDDAWGDQFHTGVFDMSFVKTEDGSILEKGPKDTHVFHRDEHTKAWERRNNALRLFGKYYHSLWD
jgi:hypothetical protein